MALSFLSRLEADKRGLFIEVPSRSTQRGFFGSWPLLFALHFLLTGQMRKRRSYLSLPTTTLFKWYPPGNPCAFPASAAKVLPFAQESSPHFHATCSSTQIWVICWVIPSTLKELVGNSKKNKIDGGVEGEWASNNWRWGNLRWGRRKKRIEAIKEMGRLAIMMSPTGPTS